MKNSLLKIVKLISTISLVAVASANQSENPDILTKKCIGCHGVNFEKHALGKSKIVGDFNSTQIVTALKGYKDGTYGGTMKVLMKGQVSGFSDENLTAIAEKITKK